MCVRLPGPGYGSPTLGPADNDVLTIGTPAVMTMACPLLVGSLLSWTFSGVTPVLTVRASRRVAVLTGSAVPDPQRKSSDERQRYLAQLFGEEASAKIALEATNVKDTVGPDIVWVGAEGVGFLEWGEIVVAEEETCSIDRDAGCMPLQPTMIKLQPLLPNTKLFCYRLDMPLGMLIEEDTPIVHKATVAPFVKSFVGESCEEGAETCDASQAYAGGVLAGDIVRATSYVTMGVKHEVGVAGSNATCAWIPSTRGAAHCGRRGKWRFSLAAPQC